MHNALPEIPRAKSRGTPYQGPKISTFTGTVITNRTHNFFRLPKIMPPLYESEHELGINKLLKNIEKKQIKQVLLIAEDTRTIVKIVRPKITRQAKAACFNAPIELLSFSDQSDASWENHGIAWDIIASNAIVYAGNGEIALHIIQRLPSNISIVLLTDQQMPKMEGTALINAVMTLENKKITSIALHTTVDINDTDIQTCVTKYPNVAFIPKPFALTAKKFIQDNYFDKEEIAPEDVTDSTVDLTPVVSGMMSR